MVKLLLIISVVTTLFANYKPQDCLPLLKKAVSSLNKANTVRNIDQRNMYATRSIANSNMYSICIEFTEYYNIDKVQGVLRHIKDK